MKPDLSISLCVLNVDFEKKVKVFERSSSGLRASGASSFCVSARAQMDQGVWAGKQARLTSNKIHRTITTLKLTCSHFILEAQLVVVTTLQCLVVDTLIPLRVSA